MSTLLTFTHEAQGVACDAMVTLCDRATTYGVRNSDTGTVLIAANTAVTRVGVGSYEYLLEIEPSRALCDAWWRAAYKDVVTYRQVSWRSSLIASDGTMSAAFVMYALLVNNLRLFEAPSAAATWPLTTTAMPAGPNVQAQCAAVYDTAGVVDLKTMHHALYQRYGVQLKVRSLTAAAGVLKLSAVQAALMPVHGEAVVLDNGEQRVVNNVMPSSSMAFMGQDPQGRYLHSLNFIVSMT